ncbi:hypothetical protein AMECASPLE_035774 [Ameca splendens]|uniref:Uncharacterized protein n=1 Tax=Ameca splendens TaxID=208324 RepID=A0ABV1ADU6_9TELE
MQLVSMLYIAPLYKAVKVGGERFALLFRLKKCRRCCALLTKAEVWRNQVKLSVICTPRNLMLLTHSTAASDVPGSSEVWRKRHPLWSLKHSGVDQVRGGEFGDEVVLPLPLKALHHDGSECDRAIIIE